MRKGNKKVAGVQPMYCKQCGELIYTRFFNMSEYIYKLHRNGKNTIYFCGYNCMRKYEKEHEVQRKNSIGL